MRGWVSGDESVCRRTLMGTNAGPAGTGQMVRISGYEKWRLGDDGLTTSSPGNFDAAEYRRKFENAADSNES